ncbi:MAG: ABC1 kinase family protein [Actinomycetes bacterium]
MLSRRGRQLVGALRRDRRSPVPPLRPEGAFELRRALQDLGPTYVKIGQLLSTRADLLPDGYQRELAHLQSQVPPFPWAQVVEALEVQLGRPVEVSFAQIDPVPLAAASIGQVHAAVLHDGSDVVVKVRRPDVTELVDADMALIDRVAHLVARLSTTARDQIDPVGLAEEFGSVLRRECDYTVEAAVADELRRGFLQVALPVVVPVVHHDLSAPGVLTMQRVRGIEVDDVARLRHAGLDPVAVAESFANAFMSMVFTFGVFHGDPHPGNVFVAPDGSLGLVDFGKHGRIDPTMRAHLRAVVGSVLLHDPDGLVAALRALEVADDAGDTAALRADLQRLLDTFADNPAGNVPIAEILRGLLATVRRHRLRLPPDLLLLLATVVECEGVAVQLDPGFVLYPVLARWAAEGLTTG